MVRADLVERERIGAERIPLRNKHGDVIAHALVDAVDAERLRDFGGSWHLARNGYAQRTWKEKGARKQVYLHRFILRLPTGGPHCDHVNRNRLDNRRVNLRIATNAGNGQNRGSKPGSSSRYRGVSWDQNRGKWQAAVTLDGKRHALGRFDTEDKAAAAAGLWRAANMPNATDSMAIWGVFKDLIDREAVGIARYGT